MRRLATFANIRTGGLAVLILQAEVGPSGIRWRRTPSGDRMRLPDDPGQLIPAAS